MSTRNHGHVFIQNPSGSINNCSEVNRLEDVPEETFKGIRERLQSKMSKDPTITIIIAAWNEEVNIIRCLDTLSRNETTIPFDIIVVNNNSKDRTQQVIDKLGVTSFFQKFKAAARLAKWASKGPE